MLKRFYCLALVFLAALSGSAAPIDRAAALSAAKAFMSSRGRSVQLTENISLKAPRTKVNGQEAYYIFNASNDQGFVIMSGSDRTNAVLGYSDNGHIDLDNLPDGLKALLNSYAVAIDVLDQQEADGILSSVEPVKAKKSMSEVKRPIAPFLTKFMSHRTPFNNNNPVFNDTICPTGCMTVSVGEVMAYYSHPAGSPGVYGYTTKTQGIKVETLAAMDFEWHNILPNYTLQTYDSIQAHAVSMLLRHIGQALGSDFTTKSTSAKASNVPYIMKAFGYSTSENTSMEAKTPAEWDEIFYACLSKRSPVIISGNNIEFDGSGHAFILDGYDQDDFYHIDWGWSADTNGYYRLTNLSPYNNTNSYTYMRDLAVIYNIMPKQQYTPVMISSGNACLTTNSISVEDDDILITRSNPLPEAKRFKFAIGLVDNNNQIAKVLQWDSLTFQPNQTASRHWRINDLSGVKNGSYRLFPISQVYGGDGIWHFDICKSDIAYMKVDVKNGDYVMEPCPGIIYGDTLINDEKLGFPVGAGRHFTYTITNNTMDKWEQRLYLYEDTIPMDYQMARIPPNSTQELVFTYIPQEKGRHTIYLATDTMTTNLLATREIEVSDTVKYHLKVSKFVFANYDTSKKRLYGTSFRATFTVKNDGTEDYDDFVRILIRQQSWHCTKKFLAHIPKGKTQTFSIECNNLAYAVNYPVSILCKLNSSDNSNILPHTMWSRNVSPHKAVLYWKNDGKLYTILETKDTLTMPEDALALYLMKDIKQPVSIVPNSNPNALYYVNKHYKSLEGHNEILVNKADSIILTDSFPCYVPYDFKADKIKYTRTFVKGFNGKRNGSNWSTITLPFGVDKVFNTVDSVEVDWYRPGETEGKNFWVREFYGEDGFYTYFADTDTIQANVPYIITVPDDYQGLNTCLVGKPLEFTAVNADVLSGKPVADANNFNFQGTLQATQSTGDYIYLLNEEENGNCFVFSSTETTTQPFRGYFSSETAPNVGNRLLVASYIDVSAIVNGIQEVVNEPVVAQPQRIVTGVYSITGTKIQSSTGSSVKEVLQSLPAGIYIINGRKYIK